MAAQKMNPMFKIIDDALAEYYSRLGYSNYRDTDGIGLFLKYIIDEELNDPDLPIENELGDDCDPYDCCYSWMDNDTEFPVPTYAEILDEEKEAFIYYTLQYCYKYRQPPSDQYIQSTVIPKCGGTNNTTIATSMITHPVHLPFITKREPIYEIPPLPSSHNNRSNHIESSAPTPYNQGTATNDTHTQESHRGVLEREAKEDDVTDINLDELNANIEENVELIDGIDNNEDADDDIITSIFTSFNTLHITQNVQHEVPPWAEYENIAEQDQKDNDNDIRISTSKQLNRDEIMIQSSLSPPPWNEDGNNDYSEPDLYNDYGGNIEDDEHDEENILNMTRSVLSPRPCIKYANRSDTDINSYHSNNGYKDGEIQNVHELKAIIAALKMENKRLRVDNDGLRANNNRLQRGIENQSANDHQLDDDDKYNNDGDDENTLNVARSQKNAEQKSLMNDMNENKDQNNVAAPTLKMWQFFLFLLVIMIFIAIADLSVATAIILNIHFGAKHELSFCFQEIN